MRGISKIVVLFGSLALGACSALQSERETSGGFIGQVQDDHLFNVTSDTGYVYRATAVAAALSMMAAENTKSTNTGNAKQAIGQINALAETLSNLYNLAQSNCGLPSGATAIANPTDDSNCTKHLFRTNFQPNTVSVDKELYYLATVALATSELKTLLNDTKDGNFLAMLWDFVWLARQAAVDANDAYAVGRETTQERAYVWSNGDSAVKSVAARSFEGAAKILNSHNWQDQEGLDYKVYLLAQFRTMQQNCINIRMVLNTDERRNNSCPTSFIGVTIPLEGLHIPEPIKEQCLDGTLDANNPKCAIAVPDRPALKNAIKAIATAAAPTPSDVKLIEKIMVSVRCAVSNPGNASQDIADMYDWIGSQPDTAVHDLQVAMEPDRQALSLQVGGLRTTLPAANLSALESLMVSLGLNPSHPGQVNYDVVDIQLWIGQVSDLDLLRLTDGLAKLPKS